MSGKNLKILIVSNSLAKGGKERQIIEFARWLSDNMNYKIGICLRENCVEYPIDFLERITLFKPAKRLKFPELLLYHFNVIKGFRPDIVHNWEGGVALSISILNTCFFRRVRTIDGSVRYSKKFTWKDKDYWVSRFNHFIADKVITNSLAGLMSLDYRREQKYMVIQNGFDFKRFDSYYSFCRLSDDIFKIGMVASFSRPKDYMSFICAAILLLNQRSNIHYYCIGDGAERESVMNSIPVGLRRHFTFTGAIEKPEEFIRNLDIGVLLNKKNHSEGMSNSIMEYMILGLPVICTKTGGNIELVQDSQNGFLVEAENIPEIHRKMMILLKNNELRESMGQKSRQVALERFSIETMGHKYLELYHSLIMSV